VNVARGARAAAPIRHAGNKETIMTSKIHSSHVPENIRTETRGRYTPGIDGAVRSLSLVALVLIAVVVAQPVTANETVSAGYNEARVNLHQLLEGKAFSGPTGTVGMDADHRETVLFSGGVFRSLACEEWGFEPESLRADEIDGAVHFEAVHKSEDYGTMTWRGTIRDGKLEAQYVWEKERLFWTTRREYWFSGVIEEASHDRDHAI
jgi:hypothetical protein